MEKRGHVAWPRMTCGELRDHFRRLKEPPEARSIGDRRHQCPTIRARPYLDEDLQTTLQPKRKGWTLTRLRQ